MTNTLNTPVEALEIAFPFRLEVYGLRRGSGGEGQQRGGDGIVREYTMLAPVDRHHAERTARRWRLGGWLAAHRAACGRNLLFHADGSREELPSKFTRRLLPGERLRIETPGGGGWGRGAVTGPVRIGSLLLPTDPYWVQAREAVKLRAQELGVSFVNIHLPFNTATGDLQLGLIEQLLAQELDALITPRLPEAVARQLVAAGLPLVFADEMDYGGPGMVSPRGLYDAGALAGAFMLDQIGYRGAVLLVGGQQRQLATVQARVNGFCHALAPHPDGALRAGAGPLALRHRLHPTDGGGRCVVARVGWQTRGRPLRLVGFAGAGRAGCGAAIGLCGPTDAHRGHQRRSAGHRRHRGRQHAWHGGDFRPRAGAGHGAPCLPGRPP